MSQSKRIKILSCNPDGGAFYYITKGWENAFKALGHQFIRWKGDEKTIKSYQPDIYLGCSGWRQEFPQWAKKEYGTKIGIHANPWGSTVLKPNPKEPDINEPKHAIDWTLSQKPDFIYCYGGDHDISHMWNHWTDKGGVKVIPMPTGGDAVIHKPCDVNPKFACDVGFIGGYWPYKGMNLDKYLTPVILKYNSKVYGWGGWKHIGPKYCGPIDDNKVNVLFSSAKICPTINEPHTARYGIDIPERIWKVPLGGGFVICDPCKNLDKYVNYNTFITARNQKEYFDLIGYYINRPADRASLSVKQRLEVLTNHTYFSRIQEFLRVCQYVEQANEAQEFVTKLVEKEKSENGMV